MVITQKGESKQQKKNSSLLLEGAIILTPHFRNWFYNGGFIKSIQCLQAFNMYIRIQAIHA